MVPGTSRRIVLALALIGTLSGCTRRYMLDASAGAEAYAQANRLVAARVAEVRTAPGERFRWRDVVLAADSTVGYVLVETPEPPRRAVPTSSVTEVRLHSVGAGSAEGAGYGALTGAALAAVVYLTFDSLFCWSPDVSACRGPGLLGWTGIGALSGGGLGGWIGAIRGKRTIVEVRW